MDPRSMLEAEPVDLAMCSKPELFDIDVLCYGQKSFLHFCFFQGLYDLASFYIRLFSFMPRGTLCSSRESGSAEVARSTCRGAWLGPCLSFLRDCRSDPMRMVISSSAKRRQYS